MSRLQIRCAGLEEAEQAQALLRDLLPTCRLCLRHGARCEYEYALKAAGRPKKCAENVVRCVLPYDGADYDRVRRASAGLPVSSPSLVSPGAVPPGLSPLPQAVGDTPAWSWPSVTSASTSASLGWLADEPREGGDIGSQATNGTADDRPTANSLPVATPNSPNEDWSGSPATRVEDILPWSDACYLMSLHTTHQHALGPVIHKPTFALDLLNRKDMVDDPFRAMICSMSESHLP